MALTRSSGRGLKPSIQPSNRTAVNGPSISGHVEGSARSPLPLYADLSYRGIFIFIPSLVNLLKAVSVPTERDKSWLPAFPRNSKSLFPGFASRSLTCSSNVK
uniref:Uncharacterized protein n=1 Tax=Opuntia streptacantha TaxID=393608 RepID=A0A7C9D3Z8_OPUST